VTQSKRALIVYGGWSGHHPEAFATLAEGLLTGAGFEVERSTQLDVFADREKMAALELVVPIWTMGELAEAQERGLLEAVAGGVGVAGWHGGMGDAFRGSPGYQFMVGGQFVAHPGGIVTYEVNLVKPEDPIVAGLADFTVTSEQYYLHVDPANEVLATTTFSGEHAPWVEGCVMPVVWKKRFGAGRVFYCALGHAPEDFAVPEVLEIVRRGLLWAGRADV